ncbi:enoyl-CoA hydratase/isomerase family protein [Nocardioides nitrophenolicus]|uniref:enoyl-CoA hydratase/isomerase family protein n=1 Tax=Nocardioides nitrophenolicus TaxID=60489 RepID=UPI0019578DCB|nr:enoyl-CoA hydratase/isomerase family protein [Nocardioides nitrophenolicus]MBM7519272.1 enoyl-CoA hydratase/carnithine racemase [Nocardioides nitrophenolicus]
MSVLIERGDVWTLTLDRPERANALGAGLVEDLHRALDEAAAARPETLVLRGNARHFAAGFDLDGLAAETDASLAYRFVRIGLLLERLIAAPYRTVAVAEGAAVGAGADLVLACDHRLVGPARTLRFPGAAFGVALGGVRRRELGVALTTGVPADLPAVLTAPAPPRPAHDGDAELAALARSVAVPGLRDRIAAYKAALTKESA